MGEAPKVAVVAVHGVGHHEPGKSAEAVSSLLANLTDPTSKEHFYRPFVTSTIHIPLQPVAVRESSAALQSAAKYLFPAHKKPGEKGISSLLGGVLPPAGSGSAGRWKGLRDWLNVAWKALVIAWIKVSDRFDERRGYLATMRVTPDRRRQLHEDLHQDPGRIALEFMRSQLAGYEGATSGEPYVTVRLEGLRSPGGPSGTPPTEVDVYEAYWADLARPTKGAFRFFGALYQLLFHLTSLSRFVVDHAEVEHAGEFRWALFRGLQALAVRFIGLLVPGLNLMLLLVGIAPLAQREVQGNVQSILAVLGCAVVGLIATYLGATKFDPPKVPLVWSLIPAVGAAIFGAVGLVLVWVGEAAITLTWVWIIVAGLLLWLVAAQYDKVRAGAKETFLILGIPTVVLLGLYLAASISIEQAAFWTLQILFGFLAWAWGVYLVLAILASLAGFYCWLKCERKSPQRARALAAVRTSRMALALPTSMLVIVTLVLWSGLIKYGTRHFPMYDSVQFTSPEPPGEIWNQKPPATVARLKASQQHPFRDALFLPPEKVLGWYDSLQGQPAIAKKDRAATINRYFNALLLLSVTAGLPILLGLIAAGFFLLFWMALPSAILEVQAPGTSAPGLSRRLGEWLSRGLDSIKYAITSFWWAVFPVMLLFAIGDYLSVRGVLLGDTTNRSVTNMAAISLTILTLAVSFFVLVSAVAKYGSVVLDSLLDVDNYLRTSPAEATPRAKMCERLVSVLRYLAARRDSGGKPYYERVVIVAHSLGSVLCADLLYFLKQEVRAGGGDPALEKFGFAPSGTGPVPLRLFTMGSPLRQLLNRFFPHLYWWVRGEPDGALQTLPPSDEKMPAIDGTARPYGDELGVHYWVNAYRSGDYVGRSVWQDPWYMRKSPESPEDPQVARRVRKSMYEMEMCIGAGAHTHYWDRTAPDIARQLDELIAS